MLCPNDGEIMGWADRHVEWVSFDEGCGFYAYLVLRCRKCGHTKVDRTKYVHHWNGDKVMSDTEFLAELDRIRTAKYSEAGCHE